MGYYEYVEKDGEKTKKTQYSCTKKALKYTTISDEIKSDFNFLLSNGDICSNLDLMLEELEKAANISDAFYFENGGSVSELHHVYEEIRDDVKRLKEQLVSLHTAFMTDIDNVNAELDNNFGHIVAIKVKAGRTVVEE